LPVIAAEGPVADIGQHDAEHLRHTQADQGRANGRGGKEAAIHGRIGDFEQIAGQRRIFADQLFNGVQVGIFLEQLLLHQQHSRVEQRERVPLRLQLFLHGAYVCILIHYHNPSPPIHGSLPGLQP
jgi:hypothetical protein